MAGDFEVAYTQSASIYDLLYIGIGRKDYPREAGQIDQLICDRNPSAATLLDVACSTGHHPAHLRGRYGVEGVNASPQMLAVARSRLPDVPLRLCDMRALDLGREFDAVTCLFSSIGYLTDPAELRQTISRLARHLAPGGVLVIEGWVRPDAREDEHRPTVEHAEDRQTLGVRLGRSWRDGNLSHLEEHHLVRTGAGISHFVELLWARASPTPPATVESGPPRVRPSPSGGRRCPSHAGRGRTARGPGRTLRGRRCSACLQALPGCTCRPSTSRREGPEPRHRGQPSYAGPAWREGRRLLRAVIDPGALVSAFWSAHGGPARLHRAGLGRRRARAHPVCHRRERIAA